MTSSPRPRFISLEGSEACGKSTQLDLLQKRLENLGQKVLVTREPGGTPLGEALRHLLKHAKEGHGMSHEAELLLFAASRAQLVRQIITPALADGVWVLSDRFLDSTTVYQGMARGLPTEKVEAVNDFAVGGLKPGLTLVLDLETEVALDRLRRRVRPVGESDRMEAEPEAFYEKVRRGYHEIAEREPERLRLINAGDPIDDVHTAIWKEVRRAFSLE